MGVGGGGMVCPLYCVAGVFEGKATGVMFLSSVSVGASIMQV